MKILPLLIHLIAAASTVDVKIKMEDDWKSSFGLELLQYVSKVGNIFSMIYILKLEGYLSTETPQMLYNYLFDKERIGIFVPSHLFANLNLSLATREFAPAVQAYFQHYSTIVTKFDDCDNWVNYGGIQHCSAEDWGGLDAWIQPELLNFDHQYQSRRKFMAVFYADIYSEACLPILSKLTNQYNSNPDFGFVMRFKPSQRHLESVYVSGYGVELAVKSTEYNAVDDRKVEVNESDINSENFDASGRSLFGDAVAVVKKLEPKEITDIAFKAISYSTRQHNRFETLTILTEDFPKLAHHLLPEIIDPEVQKLASGLHNLLDGEQFLTLNGLILNIQRLNAYDIIKLMRAETILDYDIQKWGISGGTSLELKTSPLGKTPDGFEWGNSFDLRSAPAFWLNDLENDPRYTRFPPSFIDSILQSQPNSFIYTKKNLFSIVAFIDVENVDHFRHILTFFQIIQQNAPWRVGFIPVVDVEFSDLTSYKYLITKALHFLFNKNHDQFLQFLTTVLQKLLFNSQVMDATIVKESFLSVTGASMDSTCDLQDITWSSSLMAATQQLGVTSTHCGAFMNGVFVPLSENYLTKATDIYFKMIKHLQDAITNGLIGRETNIYDYFMTLPNVSTHRSSIVFLSNPSDIKSLNFNRLPAAIVSVNNLKWVHLKDSPPAPLSVLVFADFTDPKGLLIAQEALRASKTCKLARWALVHNAKKSLSSGELCSSLDDSFDELCSLFQADAEFGSQTELVQFLQTNENIKISSTYVTVNGRLVGPIVEEFREKDFITLINYEYSERVANVHSALESFLATLEFDFYSHILFLVSSALTDSLSGEDQPRLSTKKFLEFRNTSVCFESGLETSSSLRFEAILDPVSPVGQKALSFLSAVVKVPDVFVRVFTSSHTLENVEKLPLNRFYRFSFLQTPKFGSDSSLTTTGLTFDDMPENALLTMGIDVPGSWLVRPTSSLYDLDNIDLSKIPSGSHLNAEFTLKSILVEGHAIDSKLNTPPRGLQFILESDNSKSKLDTITMANLGYLQFKAAPGVWAMKIREGRSDEVYQLMHLRENEKLKTDGKVIVDSFVGVTVYPVVNKKPGMRDENVLNDNLKGEGIFDRFKTTLI